jgi:hypothetical protein
MSNKKDYQSAARERVAREEGRTIPHYAAKVTRKLAGGRKRGASTPSKKG